VHETVDMVGTDNDDDILTVDEVRSRLAGISDDEARKLIHISKWFAVRCSIPAEDLRQEAILRVLSGSRRCRRGGDFVRFLAGVIKSLASAESEAKKAGARPELVAFDGANGPDPVDETPSPERLVASRLDDGQTLAEIDRVIADDEQLELLVEGLADNMIGEDLEVLLGVDVKGLAAVRKRLKRRLLNEFSERMGR
jgi:DNA-directed RNA polymerase specialized sigma24 family protein